MQWDCQRGGGLAHLPTHRRVIHAPVLLARPMVTGSPVLLWLATLSLAGWLYLIFWRGSFWRAEALPDPAVPSQQRLPDVIAVVPARNEAPYLARTLHSPAGCA